MTDEKLEEETNQTRTKTIQAKEFIKGKIPLDNLPQPYVIISDSGDLEFENLGKTINILAIKQNYRIVSFAATDVDDGINYGYVIMEKKGAV
jgi:hypothetical protein